MKYLAIGLIFLSLISLYGSLHAEAQPLSEPREVRLFNEGELDGWKITPFTNPGEVIFSDTVVVLRQGNAMTGITWTKSFPKLNYEVVANAMRVEGRDFFYGLTFPVRDEHCTLIVGGWGGTVVGLSSIDGLDASENMSGIPQSFENGRWYRIRLRVTEESITAWIDDKEVVDVNTEGRRFSIRPEVILSQPFGIATWHTSAALKDLRLRWLE